jgi:glutamine phosphoribosylpyrophosphate amidotransferase
VLNNLNQPVTEKRTWCISENSVSLAFNGNIPDHIQERIKKEINYTPVIGTDTELLLHTYLQKGEDWIIENIPLSYVVGILDARDKEDPKLVMLRDRYQVKPFCYTDLENKIVGPRDKFVGASETLTLDDKKNIKWLKSAEKLVVHTKTGKMESAQINPIEKEEELARCLFEFVYFTNDNSEIDEIPVSNYRFEVGWEMVRELEKRGLLHGADRIDHLIGIPHSGLIYTNAAFARIMREYPDVPITTLSVEKLGQLRTYIQKDTKDKKVSSEKKYHFQPSTKPRLKEKHLGFGDDSGVEGTTADTFIRMSYNLVKSAYTEYKVKEITFIYNCPEIVKGCDKGVVIRPDELMALDKYGKVMSEKEIADKILKEAFDGKVPEDAPRVNVVYPLLELLTSTLLRVYKKFTGNTYVKKVGICTECMKGGSCSYQP